MKLPLSVEFRLRVLTNPYFLLWHESGLGVPAEVRRSWQQRQRIRIAHELGLASPTMPLEQLDLLLQHTPDTAMRADTLGLVGEALDFLANRYIRCVQGKPTPVFEHLGELQQVKLRMVVEQLACWQVARQLVDVAIAAPCRREALPCVDWEPGLAVERHHLALALERPLVEGHVHLGGVLGTLELWAEVLDPRCESLLRRPARHSILNLGPPSLGAVGRARLLEARSLRDLLWLEIRRLGGRQQPTERAVLARATKDFSERVLYEREISAWRDGGAAAIATAITAQGALVPALLSPYLAARQSRAREPDAGLRAERELLLQCFAAVLGGFPGQRAEAWLGPVLSVYLVCQNLFHAETTQQHGRVGLGNFLQWYEAPARWFKASESVERQHQILERVSRRWRDRVEGRLTPDPRLIRSWLRAFHFRRSKPAAQLGRDFGLVVHFIKQADPREPKRLSGLRPRAAAPGLELSWPLGRTAEAGRQPPTTAVDDPPWLLRHEELRRRLRHQAYALEHFREAHSEAAWAVLGIDAARNEGDTPPEVFAPAFRYLRRRLPPSPRAAGADGCPGPIPPLRATFHVGESFHDPITGLRAAHEAIRFLDLRPGDRLGHAMVLGIDANSWKQNTGAPPQMMREELLDNLVWLQLVLREQGAQHLLPAEINSLIAWIFQEIYPDVPLTSPISLNDLLAWAWRLRWMDPIELFAVLGRMGWSGGSPPSASVDHSSDHHAATRDRFAGTLVSCSREGRCLRREPGQHVPTGHRKLCAECQRGTWSRSPIVLDATLSPRRLGWRVSTLGLDQLFSGQVPIASLHLLWRYWFDRRVYRRGHEIVEWPTELSDPYRLFEPLRKAVLAEVAQRDLTIEVCPTSNQVIGGFGDLHNHPIFRFDTRGLKYGETAGIRVMVCSDDPGIFATNLPGELANLAWAAEQRGENPNDVLAWIEHLRRQGAESSFLHVEGIETPQAEAPAWPPNLALHPEWRDAHWRALALAQKQQSEGEKLRDRIRRSLLG